MAFEMCTRMVKTLPIVIAMCIVTTVFPIGIILYFTEAVDLNIARIIMVIGAVFWTIFLLSFVILLLNMKCDRADQKPESRVEPV
jgi:hypothetical protein